jgi:hypothetical protein
MPASAITPSRMELNKPYSSIMISNRLSGTMKANRFLASTNAPYSPVHSMR